MASDRADLAQRLSDAARELQGVGPQETMDDAVRLAVNNVHGADAAGLSLVRRRRRVESPAFTEDYVKRSDELQNDLNEGPCLDAIFREKLVHAPDLTNEGRWPRWAPRIAEDFGVRSMMCFQLFTNEDTVGALNLYSTTPDAFDAVDRDDGLAFAAHVAVAVAAAQKIEQLDTAVARRTVIGKALGILMERYDFSDDAAFAVLSRLSSQSNRKLFEVAEEIVRTRRVGASEETSPA